MGKKVMAPLWVKCPNIPNGSMGWRMGYGESYGEDFYLWFLKLSAEEKESYNEKFQKPICWSLDEENLMTHNKFWTYNWIDRISGYSVSEILKEDNREKVFFWGHRTNNKNTVGKECLSQWYMSKFEIGVETYCCMEQYIMAKKALLFGDEEIKEKIMETTNQKIIKDLGRKVRNFQEDVWNKFKMPIALTGNYFKFSQNSKLREYLLSTGDKLLVEASPYDVIWGIGMGVEEASNASIEEWRGENILGFTLMAVRDEIKRLRKFENEIDNI